MFTDIQGYTALMQRDEKKAIRAREKHRQIFNSTTEKYKGKILQYYGDGTLSIFDSAIDAVNCGIEMQLSFQEDPSIPVRIGIHTGDVLFSDEEIIGDGVNVASRIESLSVPGSVFISDKVYDDIKNQESIQASMLKSFKLKNVEKPIEVYAISNVGLIVPDFEDISGKMDPDFSSMSEKPEQSISSSGPILATKLYIPPPRLKVVLRPHLIEQLNESMHCRLILISAPPGFGKSTLVSEWVASSERPTAWLSLDKGDNEATRFLVYLISALRTIVANIGERALSLLQSPQMPPIESILTTLLNEIISVQDNFTLVLDDYHVIDAKEVDNLLAFLLDHMPPQMHLIITTREDPNLPLPRLRVRGQLAELRSTDLRFTLSETAEFLNRVMDLKLSAAYIDALEASTEGWVAGLQLAALSMQGREDIPGFIKSFAGDDHYVVDYLVEEVLQSQPDNVRNFLLQTSILDRLNGSLCDAVTDQDEGKGLLETLERANLFVVPLDDKRQWYRYHHLFAEVLRARSIEEQPERITALHRQASEWYEQNDLPADAIHHALEAGDIVRAAGLVELAWPAMNESCQASTWLGWAKTLPIELLYSRPVLSVGFAWALLQCGEMETVEAHLHSAEHWLDTGADTSEGSDDPSSGMIIVDEEQFQSLAGSIANARAYHAQTLGDIPDTLKYTQQALDLLPEGDYMKRAIPTAMLGFVHWSKGDLDAARESFTEIVDSFQTAGDISATIGLSTVLADIKKAQGRFQEAASIYEKSMKLAMDFGEPVPLGTEDIYRGISELHLERGDLEAARANLRRSEELVKNTLSTDWQYRLCLTQARLKESQGDLDGALDLLDKAEGLYFISPMPDLSPVAALKTRIWIRQDKLADALVWAHEQELSFDDNLSYLHEFEHLTLARVLIARYINEQEDRFINEAMELLEGLLEAAIEGERSGSMIEILVQQALAYEAQGNISGGLDPLKKALTLAQAEGYVQIFVGEGIPMSKLLSKAAANKIIPDYVGKLLAAIEAEI